MKITINKQRIQMYVIVLLLVFFESFMDPTERNINQIFSWILGYIGYGGRNQFYSSLMKYFLPQIVMLLLWGDYIRENVVNNYELIFTRSRNSYRVLWRYYIRLIANVTITVLFFELAICVVYYFKGSNINDLFEICLNIGMYCLYTNCLLMFVNVVSLGINSIYGVVIILGVQILALEKMYRIVKSDTISKIYYFLPTSPTMFVYNVNIKKEIKFIWMIMLIVVMIILYSIGCRYTSRKEFL